MTRPRTTPDQWRAAADTLRTFADQWDEKAEWGNRSPELREQIGEILGLEESPDGEPFYLLTRDQYGVVFEGVDYAEEVEQLAAMIEGALAMHQVQLDRANELDKENAALKLRLATAATLMREAVGGTP